MKLETVKKVVIALACAVFAAGNIYEHVKKPDPSAVKLTFLDTNEAPSEDIAKGSTAENAAPKEPSSEASKKSGLIDINTASAAELTQLPGIGEVKARAIVKYREDYGSFTCTEEITEVKGIGQATYEKIKNRITVN